MKYFIYARKSSDSEDRQVLSIESQLQELREFAAKENLEVIQEFTESKTAKEPGRPIFNQMLTELEQSQADGIIAWQPDRLSRNSVDGGKIIYLIDQGVIKDLKFPTYLFDLSPHGKFNLSLAFGFSKLYVDNLSQNVKRGIREKLRRGEFPGPAPRGYVNNLKTHTIEACPETFDTIKALLMKYAAGDITLPQMNKELFNAGIKTKKGLSIGYSSVERLLSNPFYYGIFKLNGELHPGSHPAMITKDVFDQIQKRLANIRWKVKDPETKKHDKNFLFTELGKCGECGYSITSEFHIKKSGKEYRYYRCSKKSKVCNCQQKAINEKDLALQIEKLSSEIAINDDWHKWCQTQIREWRDQELESTQEQVQNCQKTLESNKKRLERLLDLKIDGEISLDEYKSKKNEIVNLNSHLEGQINKIAQEGSSWFELLSTSLETSNEAHHRILEKDFTGMFKILRKTGLNSILHDQNLSLTFFKPFSFFREAIMLTGRCGSPKEIHFNNYSQTQLQSGVGGQSRSRRLMPAHHTAVHEPVRASGRRGERSEPSLGSGAVCECVSEWRAL